MTCTRVEIAQPDGGRGAGLAGQGHSLVRSVPILFFRMKKTGPAVSPLGPNQILSPSAPALSASVSLPGQPWFLKRPKRTLFPEIPVTHSLQVSLECRRPRGLPPGRSLQRRRWPLPSPPSLPLVPVTAWPALRVGRSLPLPPAPRN